MGPTLTSAQQSFVDSLKLQNIDHLALQIVISAMHVRNAAAHNPLPRLTDATDVLVAVVDKAAS